MGPVRLIFIAGIATLANPAFGATPCDVAAIEATMAAGKSAGAAIDGCWANVMTDVAAMPAEGRITHSARLDAALQAQLIVAAQVGRWQVPEGLPWRRVAARYRVQDAYGRLLAAYHADDANTVSTSAADVRAFGTDAWAALSEEGDLAEAQVIRVEMAQARGLSALATGNGGAALEALHEAAAIEAELPRDAGRRVAKPSADLLAEVAAILGRE